MRASTIAAADDRPRRTALALAVAAHVAVIAALLGHAPARRAVTAAAPVVVTFPVALPAERPTEAPKPMPLRAATHRAPAPAAKPLPSVPVDAPAPVVADAAAREEPRQPVPVAAPPSAAAAPAVQAIATPPAATAPGFDAAYLDNPPPVYPPIARRSGEQGRVVLRVLVAPNGTAETVEVRTSSGSTRLDNAALETVRRWRFVPARRGDVAIAAWVLVPIAFSLEH